MIKIFAVTVTTLVLIGNQPAQAGGFDDSFGIPTTDSIQKEKQAASNDIENVDSSGANPHKVTSLYSVSPEIGAAIGDKYFLVKNGDSWKPAAKADLRNKDIELISINPVTKKIKLMASPPTDSSRRGREFSRNNQWECFKGLLSSKYRSATEYSICSSEFANGVTGSVEAVIGSLNLLFGTTRHIVAVDQEKLLRIAESSGLIEMVERRHQEIIEADQRKEQEIESQHRLEIEAAQRKEREIESQQRLDQEVIARLDKEAEEGDANAKYQRGLKLQSKSRWDSVAKEWFEKAAIAGHAGAVYELGLYQLHLYNNESEAEKLLSKASKQGNQDARQELVKLKQLQQHRLAEAEAQRRQLEASLARVKTIGQKICTSFDGESKIIIGHSFGKPIYAAPQQRNYRVHGFTENVNISENRIQIRIGGIIAYNLNGESLGNTDRVDGDVVYANGAVIWDSALRWSPC